MTFPVLLSPEELWTRLRQGEEMVVVDCRYDLSDHLIGFFQYREGHIPGAIYCHLSQDLAAPPSEKGRHPLPEVVQLTQRLGELGISRDLPVVVYDDCGGAFASRLFWTLRYLGHSQVALLDGGWQHWLEWSGPLEQGVRTRSHCSSKWEVQPHLLATREEVQRAVLEKKEKILLIDARAKERYLGVEEPIDPVAGHIPGAQNFPYQQNLDEKGRFLAKSQLIELYRPLLNDTPSHQVVFYCGSGVTSCLNFVALEYLGLGSSRVYIGSWSEWCRNHLPIGRGETQD